MAPFSIIILMLLSVISVKSECCHSNIVIPIEMPPLSVCKDCSFATPYCGYGGCNVFGCDCDGGCRSPPQGVKNDHAHCFSYRRYDMSNDAYPSPYISGLEDWMKQIDDDMLLSEISIPGTHDTMATRNFWHATAQGMSLYTQLLSGIRFLDIRCKVTDGIYFAIFHGSVYLNANFNDVLDTIKIFLDKYPSETIIMRVKQEKKKEEPNDPRFVEIFDGYRSQYQRYFYNTGRDDQMKCIPVLWQVRGLIVLFRQFQGNAGEEGYEWNHKFVKVRDNFTIMNPADKFQHFKGFLTEIESGSKNAFYVNFASTTFAVVTYPSWLAWINVIFVVQPKHLASGVNGIVLKYLQENSNKRSTGISVFDFPGKKLIQAVINLNVGVNVGFQYYNMSSINLNTSRNSQLESIAYVNEMILKSDTNGDEKLNFKEAMWYVKKVWKQKYNESQFTLEFMNLDKNFDGHLSKSEINP